MPRGVASKMCAQNMSRHPIVADSCSPNSHGVLLYDGSCPLCTTYCHALQAGDGGARLVLTDGRSPSKIRAEAEAAGLDLDEGFVLKWGGSYYHGAEALHALTRLSEGGDPFSRLNRFLFRNPRICRAVYPAFGAYRAVILWILGVPSIGNMRERR